MSPYAYLGATVSRARSPKLIWGERGARTAHNGFYDTDGPLGIAAFRAGRAREHSATATRLEDAAIEAAHDLWRSRPLRGPSVRDGHTE